MTAHEKCTFPYIKMPEDKHLKVLGMDKKKKKANKGYDDDDSQEHDEYEFDDEMDQMDYDIVDANEQEDQYQEAQGYGNESQRDGYDDDNRSGNSYNQSRGKNKSFGGNKSGSRRGGY